MLEIQPHFQPALLSLSAIISQYFTGDASCLFCTPYGNANFPASRRRFRFKMNCHVGEGFPKVRDNRCLVDRFDGRLDRSDHRLSEIRSAVGCINRLAGCFAAFRATAGTVPNPHSHSRAYIKGNTRSYPDSEPDTITKPSTFASASPTFTPPPIAITSSASDSRLRCGWPRDRDARARGRFQGMGGACHRSGRFCFLNAK